MNNLDNLGFPKPKTDQPEVADKEKIDAPTVDHFGFPLEESPATPGDLASIKEKNKEKDEAEIQKIRTSLGLTDEGKSTESFKKLEGLIEPLNRARGHLRRQEREDGVSVIDVSKFSGAVSNLEQMLQERGVATEDLAQALRHLANVIKESGELPRIGRDIDRIIENMRRVIFSLRAVDDEALSLGSSFQETPEIQLSLATLKNNIEEKASKILQAIHKLQDYRGR